MREILFRGKSVIHGCWEFGDLITSFGKTYIANTVGNNRIDWCEVHPESVGQFTGLLDKNVDKIFEGDILEVDGGDEICNSVIKWDSELAGWVDYRDFDGDSFRCLECDMDWCQDTRIIGNVFDTPELTGKEASNG